jgi:hypothetical protein
MTMDQVRKALIGLIAVLLAALACLAVRPAFRDPVTWTPDALYYQARVLELRGASREEALARTFAGPLAAELRARDPHKTGNPEWVAYNRPFYERRLAVPAAGAVLYPHAGDRSLLYISLAGYVASILALFGLLLLRFGVPIASAVALATIVLQPLQSHSSYPLTDSWGLTLEIAALAAAILALDRGMRWLLPWVAAIALLGITRDTTWIPIAAVAWCAFRYRSRLTGWLLGTGVAAALPALLLFEAPVRNLLALLVNDSEVPSDPSWSFIVSSYPGAVVELLRANVGFLRRGEWYTAAYFVLGIVLLFLLVRRRPERLGPAGTLMRAGAVAGVLYVLAAPVFSAFRLELVLVPMAAFGLALGIEAVTAAVRARAAEPSVPATPQGGAVGSSPHG